MKTRRVVTGHTAEGKATFASDTEVEGITFVSVPGLEFHRLWGADSAPTFPDDGSPPFFPAYLPPVGGFRFGLLTLPPDSTAPAENPDPDAQVREFEEKVPGLIACMEPDSPGMHTTDAVDYVYILSGEIAVELDDGEEATLRAGDVLIQNGTRHAWHNRGSESCRVVICSIGTHRK